MDPRLAADAAFRTRFEREARPPPGSTTPPSSACRTRAWRRVGDDVLAFLVMELVEGGTLRDVVAARGALDVPTARRRPRTGARRARRGAPARPGAPRRQAGERADQPDPARSRSADFGLVTAGRPGRRQPRGHDPRHRRVSLPRAGSTGCADARSDVYAAGVLAFELLTGTVPFTGDTAISVAYRHVHDEVPAPSTQRSAGSRPELDDLVVRATRRDPAARPADAAAFLAALCRVAERARGPACRHRSRRRGPTHPRTPRPPGRRRPAAGDSGRGAGRACCPTRRPGRARPTPRPRAATERASLRHRRGRRGDAGPAGRRGGLVPGRRAVGDGPAGRRARADGGRAGARRRRAEHGRHRRARRRGAGRDRARPRSPRRHGAWRAGGPCG